MPVEEIRFRRESFGFTLSFADGSVGFFKPEIASVLLRGASREELEEYRLQSIPITPNFHLCAPFIAWLELTRECNLPCKHCYVEAGRQRQGELSTAEIFRVLQELREKGVFAIVLVGGEPMMHPDFIPIVRRAHELGFVISIATNGTYITQEIIDALPREECIVSVSLDGVAFHKEMRVRSSYEDVSERLLLLKKNGVTAAVMTTLTDRNVGELEQVFQFASEHGFFFGTAPFSPLGRGRFFPQYLPGEEVVEQASQLFIKEYLHEDRMMHGIGRCVARFLYAAYRLSAAMRREFCGIALTYILSDGSVYPCSACSSTGKFLAGNLRQQPFGVIWEESFKDIRRITFDDFSGCKSCELSADRYFCTARCPVMSEIYTGDPFQCGATPYLKLGLQRKTQLMEIHSIEH